MASRVSWMSALLLGFWFDLLFYLGWLQSRSTHSQQILEENRQAVILFAIIILFFICHLPRMFLNLHEALTFEQKKRDYLHGCRGVPLWILIIGLLSHLLLTCNSAFNFILYCAMSEVFRHELILLLKRWCHTLKTCNGILSKSSLGKQYNSTWCPFSHCFKKWFFVHKQRIQQTNKSAVCLYFYQLFVYISLAVDQNRLWM